MNQGKLEVVKQEMARVTIDILGISELKWTGMVCLGDEQRSFCPFDIASKYCILDSFVDHGGYSISTKGFLPTVVDIMVI